MAIQIVRNSDANCITFRGSTRPTYFNACLSAEVDANYPTRVNIINDVATHTSVDLGIVYEFYQIPFDLFRDADNQVFTSAQDCVDYINAQGNVLDNRLELGGNDRLDFTRDPTHTTILVSNGDQWGANSIHAQPADDGTISIFKYNTNQTLIYRGLQVTNATINDAPLHANLQDAVNQLNALFTVQNEGHHLIGQDVIPANDIYSGILTTGANADVTVDGLSVSTSGAIDAPFNATVRTAGVSDWGEYYQFEQDLPEGDFIIGLLAESGVQRFQNLDTQGSGISDMQHAEEGFYVSARTNNNAYFATTAPQGSLQGPAIGVSGYSTWRVGIDAYGYGYVGAATTSGVILVTRSATKFSATSGLNLQFGAKIMSIDTSLSGIGGVMVHEKDTNRLDPIQYWYILSNSSFHYPLFRTQEEAQYVDIQNGGSGVADTNVFSNDPLLVAWFSPETGFTSNGGARPSDTADITWNQVVVDGSTNDAPPAASIVDQTFDENVTVNLSVPTDSTYTTTVVGLPNGLTYDSATSLIQGTTSYVSSDTVNTVTVTRTNATGATSSTFTITVQDNAALGDLANFTELGGNYLQPNRIILDEDAVLQYDYVLGSGQQLTYSYGAGAIPPTIGILNSTGETALASLSGSTLGSAGYDFADASMWSLRYATGNNYIGGSIQVSEPWFDLTGWSDNNTITGSNNVNHGAQFKLEYGHDGYIRLYRDATLLKTSAVAYSGSQTLTFAGFDDQQQTDLYIPSDLAITNIGAGSTTPPQGFVEPLIVGEMNSLTLLGANDGVTDSAVYLSGTLEVNHRYIFPQTWIEANVLPYTTLEDADVYIGVPQLGADFTDVGGVGDFDAWFNIERFSDPTKHRSKIRTKDQAAYDTVVVNSNTDAYYDYALEWDGTDLHVIACNVNDINTQPGINQGGSFSRVVTASGYTDRGVTDLPLVIGVDSSGQVNLTTAGLQSIRIPWNTNYTILAGEASAGGGRFGQVAATNYDTGSYNGQHAPNSLSYLHPTLNAGYTYTYIYHASMESGDFIEFRTNDGSVYTSGITTYDYSPTGDPAYSGGYKGITFAVPSDVPPLSGFLYNSHNTGSYDSGRAIPIAGSTYVVPVSGVTQEGPAINQSGTMLFNDPATDGDGVVWGWASLDEQLGAGERLVMDNAFMVDLTNAMPNDSAVFIGLKSNTWTSNYRNNSIANATFAGARFAIYKYSAADIRVFGYVTGGSTIGRNFGTNGIANNGCELAFEITSDGNDIRLMMRSTGTGYNSSDDVTATAYEDWSSSYRTSTGNQGYGLTSLDIMILGDANVSSDAADAGMDTADVDWSGLTEIVVPTQANSITTSWTKALDFSGGSERTEQVTSNSNRCPIMMGGVNNNVSAHPSGVGFTSNDSNARPWATAIVFNSDGNASNQHIWNLGEGSGTTDDNIYLRVDASGNLYFGWGRSGEINECHISYFGTISSNTWYGVYIASTGERIGGTYTAADIADCFDIRLVNLSTGAAGSNYSTSATWTSGGFGYRMNRQFTGDMTIGGRGANRNFHGKVAAMVVTTLRQNVAMPTDAEISMMVRDPEQWMTDYKVGNDFRLPWEGTDAGFNWARNDGSASYSTQVWLMGDGTNDAYSQIRNAVHPATQIYTPMNMISMNSNDIETVNITGLT